MRISTESRGTCRQYEAKSTRITIAKSSTTGDPEAHVLVRFDGLRGRRTGESAAHPEMHEECRVVLEVEKQVFRSSPDAFDPATAAPTTELLRPNWLPQCRTSHNNILDTPTDKKGSQAPCKYFDFWKLRHLCIVPA
jgi:hypothetical protein